MSDVLRDLQPERLWELFGNIAKIPHGSLNEKALAGALRLMAEDAGLTVQEDTSGNLCIAVPASPGYEKAPIVVLQGHLDMVCEKNKDVDFDFTKDAIRLVRDGDWIRADGTTLGADNGIGIAAALAVAFTNEAVHGPLEILLTVNEETGLTGALNLSPSLLKGRILLNLDSERTGGVCIGCAGGGGVTTFLPVNLVEPPRDSVGLEVKLAGLQGGHSGINIHENRGNAVKLTARTVIALGSLGITLAEFHSGDKLNAIPREGFATCVLPRKAFPRVQEIIARQNDLFRTEFPNEPALQISVTQTHSPPTVLSTASSTTALTMLMAFPHGVLAMNRELDNLVETSNNLSSAHMKGNVFVVHNTPRSSLPQALQTTIDQIVAVANLAGGTNQIEESYPGWQPNPHSKILKLFEETYHEIFGNQPRRAATHAGLECGVIGDTYEGMDMISFGPTIVNAHSPDEAVSISSVQDFWKLLMGLLENSGKQGNTQ
jgi:dipeptidase D